MTGHVFDLQKLIYIVESVRIMRWCGSPSAAIFANSEDVGNGEFHPHHKEMPRASLRSAFDLDLQ